MNGWICSKEIGEVTLKDCYNDVFMAGTDVPKARQTGGDECDLCLEHGMW